MPNVEVQGLSKGFGENKVLKDISFKVGAGEYVIVLGPSGCGKTTLLKTMAGLYEPGAGRVLVGGEDVTDLQPEERRIGFFFQHYHLFPHLTVAENVGYSMRVRGMDEGMIQEEVEEKLRLVGLTGWGGHLPHELSGGMQQRTALARVLASGYKLLLLDEPLNALDAKIASMLRTELKSMAKRLGMTVLHVTPNQAEAMELSDKILLLNDGRVVQYDTDVECYLRPKTTFAAHFIGESNFLKAEKVDSHTVRCKGALFQVKVEVPEDRVILAIRPEKIRFGHHERNTLEGVVEAVSFLGATTRYEISRKGGTIVVETSKQPQIKPEDRISLYIPPEDILVFPASEPLDDDITVL